MLSLFFSRIWGGWWQGNGSRTMKTLSSLSTGQSSSVNTAPSWGLHIPRWGGGEGGGRGGGSEQGCWELGISSTILNLPDRINLLMMTGHLPLPKGTNISQGFPGICPILIRQICHGSLAVEYSGVQDWFHEDKRCWAKFISVIKFQRHGNPYFL